MASTAAPSRKRALVIGAGASGLAMLKELLAVGALDVVAMEAEEAIGGLWRFTERESNSSVYRSTVINTSKEMMNYSDFLIPKDFPLFLHNSQVLQYLNMYADHFNLRPHVMLNTRIDLLAPADDYDQTGRWRVEYTVKGDKQQQAVFDCVAVCSGHHWKPKTPAFAGQDKFKGTSMHSHSYKDERGFEDKHVVVVGVGNSGLDVAVELSRCAKQVYLVARRGTWIYTRIIDGKPLDMVPGRIRYALPMDILAAVLEKKVSNNMDLERYGLKPTHRIHQAHPSINGDLIGRICVGAIKVRPGIREMKEQSIVYDDGQELPCDAIVYATGYAIGFPFLSPKIGLSFERNESPLYRYMWPFQLKHPKTLVFIGLFQPLGAIMPISEVQARWTAQIWAGKNTLPSPAAMEGHYRQTRESLRKRYVDSERHTIQVDYPNYPDEIAREAGFYPDLWSIFFSDPALWYELVFSPAVPSHWRVTGPGKWAGARDAIMTVEDRVVYPTSGKNAKELESARKQGGVSLPQLVLIILAILVSRYLWRRRSLLK